jgi:hypothetical protein
MISILHYYSASRRLEEWNKTIKLMGGEYKAGSQLCAQRDMVEMEKKYYAEKTFNIVWWSSLAFILSVVFYSFYKVVNI